MAGALSGEAARAPAAQRGQRQARPRAASGTAARAAGSTAAPMHQQPAAVERIIAHRFADEQIHAPTIDYPLPRE